MIAGESRSISLVIGFLALAPLACRDAAPSHGGPNASATAASSAPVVPPPPPSAEELAILSPIAKGSAIDGFTVREIHGVHDGVLRVVCTKDHATVRLDVVLADDEGPMPRRRPGNTQSSTRPATRCPKTRPSWPRSSPRCSKRTKVCPHRAA
ncbi:Hypothetical protein A7982_01060 [Minicystis rosea]|nr:Hypothetical protein A7982_01060 [Minicystis rosea]